jgi:hypothetical protein
MFDKNSLKLKEFDFDASLNAGLLIVAGGFEHRALSFSEKIRKNKNFIEDSLIFKYESKYFGNDDHYGKLSKFLLEITGKKPETVDINLDLPLESCENIKNAIYRKKNEILKNNVIIDISALTHLYIAVSLHTCISSSLKTKIVYTEAKTYFPPMREKNKIIRSWQDQNYQIAANYLQSKGLKDIIIHPDFQGNFRQGKKNCLIIFVGYEPNRIEGLIDSFAPSRLIIYYGVSPHKEFKWRTQFSKDLHHNLFSNWYVHEADISTLNIDEIYDNVHKDFSIIRENFDVSIAPQNSKLQTIASYLFWREHPEVQLLFTTPVLFIPDRYSKGSRRTFELNL